MPILALSEFVFSATDVITIVGQRGSGKTTLSRLIQRAFPRLIVFDRMQEYDSSSFDFTANTFAEFARAIRDNHNRILYRFDIEKRSHDLELDEALRILHYEGNRAIVIEECWNYANARYLPHWYREILFTGRHRNLALISTSQRPAEVNKAMFSEAHHIFLGCVTEPYSLKYLQGYIGKENSEKLASLERGKFLHYRPGGHKPEIITNQ